MSKGEGRLESEKEKTVRETSQDSKGDAGAAVPKAAVSAAGGDHGGEAAAPPPAATSPGLFASPAALDGPPSPAANEKGSRAAPLDVLSSMDTPSDNGKPAATQPGDKVVSGSSVIS